MGSNQAQQNTKHIRKTLVYLLRLPISGWQFGKPPRPPRPPLPMPPRPQPPPPSEPISFQELKLKNLSQEKEKKDGNNSQKITRRIIIQIARTESALRHFKQFKRESVAAARVVAEHLFEQINSKRTLVMLTASSGNMEHS